MEYCGTITSRDGRKLLEVWLDLERGGESINTFDQFHSLKYTGVINTSMSASSA